MVAINSVGGLSICLQLYNVKQNELTCVARAQLLNLNHETAGFRLDQRADRTPLPLLGGRVESLNLFFTLSGKLQVDRND